MKQEKLGTKLRVAGFTCLGKISSDKFPHLLSQIVSLVGMSTGGLEAKIWTYPLPDGKGGTGETALQPLVESFLAIDTWPSLSHKGKPVPKVYVVLASCKPFSLDAVASYLAKEIGTVVRQGFFEL